MGMIDSIRDKRSRPGVNRYASYSMSERGTEYLTDHGITNPQSRVLAAIEACGSSATIDEIRRYSRLSGSTVENVLYSLQRQGLVQDRSGSTLGGGSL